MNLFWYAEKTKWKNNKKINNKKQNYKRWLINLSKILRSRLFQLPIFKQFNNEK